MHSSLLTCYGSFLKHLKYRSHNAQNRMSGEISSRIFETYKNGVQYHGHHIYNTAAYISMEIMCPCTSKHHCLPHCNIVLLFCCKRPIIFLPIQETNKDIINKFPTSIFHVYRNLSRCVEHAQSPYK